MEGTPGVPVLANGRGAAGMQSLRGEGEQCRGGTPGVPLFQVSCAALGGMPTMLLG